MVSKHVNNTLKRISREVFIYLLLLVFFGFNLQSQSLSILWQHCYGGTGDDLGFSVLPSQSGFNFFGQSSSTNGDVQGNHGDADLWLLSVDSSGSLLTSTCYGGTDDDGSVHMKACLDGGYILFGSPFSVNGDVTNNHGGCDYWLIKLDSNNKFQWQKCFGGSCNDEISELIVTADSGFLCIGSTCSRDGDVSVNYGYNDAWLIKVDKTGNLVWEKSFGGSIQDHGRGVVQTLDGGIIVGGGTTSEDGLVQCQHRGEFEKSDAWVIKLDSAGNIQWQNCYGGSLSDFIYKIQPLPDSTYLLLGVTNSYDGDVSGNHGDYDYWVIKIDRWGNILWQKCYGGSGYDAPVFMKTLSDGNFMIGGLTRSNDGDVTNNHSFSGYSDMWLIKISPEGELIWEQCFGGTMDEGLNDAIELPGGKLLLIGESFTCNNTGNVNCTHHGPGTFDMWVIMVYDSTLVGINKKPASTDILQVYPNPATDYVRFSSKTTNSHTDNQIYILNQLGQIIKGLTLPLGSNQVLWDTSKIPSGLYYYLCKTGKSVKTGKIVLLK